MPELLPGIFARDGRQLLSWEPILSDFSGRERELRALTETEVGGIQLIVIYAHVCKPTEETAVVESEAMILAILHAEFRAGNGGD